MTTRRPTHSSMLAMAELRRRSADLRLKSAALIARAQAARQRIEHLRIPAAPRAPFRSDEPADRLE